MSKHMQLTITIRPHYSESLKDVYPRLAQHLARVDHELSESSPSLYQLADRLDHILYKHEGTRLREVLLRHRDNLQQLHKKIRGHLADWKLAEADRLLYQMEDTFDDIEWELK